MTKEELDAMTEAEAVAATTELPEHPEGYEGPCCCDECIHNSWEEPW